MTEGERQAEIVAMVERRRALKSTIACLENKTERIQRALREVAAAIKDKQRLREVRGVGIVATPDGTALPAVDDIMATQNQLLDAQEELMVLYQRLDVV